MGLLAKIFNLWNEHGFEILFVLCVLFILIGALFRIGKKGSYTKILYNPLEDLKNINNIKFTTPHSSHNGFPVSGEKRDSQGESICRNYLEKRFGKRFNKARPNFLRNPVTGGDFNLELDCFCPELGLALEYNGAQHYKFVPYFHKNKEAFLNQKYRDEMKRTKCKENGVKLIEVPFTVKPYELENHVEKELVRLGF